MVEVSVEAFSLNRFG